METSLESFVQHFITEARAIGMTVHDGAISANAEVRVVLATKNEVGLRLVWSESSQVLSLEISQGPPKGGIAGWLSLREIQCEVGQNPPRDAPEDNLEDALEYGFELLKGQQDGT